MRKQKVKNKLILIFEDSITPSVSFKNNMRTCLIFNNEIDAHAYFKKHSCILELSKCSGIGSNLHGNFKVFDYSREEEEHEEDEEYSGLFYWGENH